MAELKPCEIPCPKCGHTDIHRVFRAKGSDWRCETYGRADNKYAGADTYVAKAWRDHIDHTCRCCKYRWQTLPLRKRRPPHRTPDMRGRARDVRADGTTPLSVPGPPAGLTPRN